MGHGTWGMACRAEAVGGSGKPHHGEGGGFGLRALTRTAAALLALLCLTDGARGLQPPGDRAPQNGGNPRRIVSLVPSATEMLFAMGAGSKVAGVSSFDRFPPDVQRLPKVGALVDPDVERILSLRPDLVIAYASQRDFLGRLARSGDANRHAG